jgi:hypothetical protein
MVRNNDTASVPATGSDGSGSAEVESDQGPSGIIDARLAFATVAPACDRYGNSSDPAAGSSSGGLGLEENAEQELEIADAGGRRAPRSGEQTIHKDYQRVARSARRCEASRVVYNQLEISLARLFSRSTLRQHGSRKFCNPMPVQDELLEPVLASGPAGLNSMLRTDSMR